MMPNFVGVDRACRNYVLCFPALLQEREGNFQCLNREEGLLSYEDGFSGRELGLLVDTRRRI
jgi:hypothetical protein